MIGVFNMNMEGKKEEHKSPDLNDLKSDGSVNIWIWE